MAEFQIPLLAMGLDARLLNRALWLSLDKPGLHLIMTLAREFPAATREELEAAEQEMKTSSSLACQEVDRICGEHYAQECTSEAHAQVRSLLPWIDSANLDLLVGRTIVNFYR